MIVTPESIRYELLLTAQTPVSHHDASGQSDSNRTLFNRQRQILERARPGIVADAVLRERIAEAHQVPVDIAEICADLSFPEFVAVVLTRVFLDTYNSVDGEGLFSGMERYRYLETRLRTAAIPAGNLRQWWNRLCGELRMPIHGAKRDLLLLDLLTLPIGTQQAVLRVLERDYRSVVAIARLWHGVAKLESEEYAEAAGQMAMVQPKQQMVFDEEKNEALPSGLIAEVPTMSSNSLRHQLVREPGWLHLVGRLGLMPDTPGQGPVPQGVEAMFYNGGNIRAGSKQPSNTFKLSMQIREAFPLLDLVGGVTDSFDIGESRVRVAGWLICRENRGALVGSPAYDTPAARVSVFDMLDDVTLTRQGKSKDLGQMIFSFETLAPGTQILTRFTLTPYTPKLTRGALRAAVEYWRAHDSTIGGQAARGFGHCSSEWLQEHDDGEALTEYENYLEEHADALREAMVEGTLGSDKVVCTL